MKKQLRWSVNWRQTKNTFDKSQVNWSDDPACVCIKVVGAVRGNSYCHGVSAVWRNITRVLRAFSCRISLQFKRIRNKFKPYTIATSCTVLPSRTQGYTVVSKPLSIVHETSLHKQQREMATATREPGVWWAQKTTSNLSAREETLKKRDP